MPLSGFGSGFGPFGNSDGFSFAFSRPTKRGGPRGPVLFFDAGNPASYSGGSTWQDLIQGATAGLSGYTYTGNGRIAFDGTGGSATSDPNIYVNLEDGFTMEVYFRLGEIDRTQGLFTFNDPELSGYMNLIFEFNQQPGQVRWEVDAGEQIRDVTGMELKIGDWYHYVGTWDRKTGLCNLYRNGVLVGADLRSCNETERTGRIEIGDYYYSGGSYMLGDFAIARMYDRAITSEEVVKNYNEISAKYLGPMLYLDAANLSSYSGTGSTWYDLGPWHHDATLLNSPTYSTSNSGTLSFDPSQLQAGLISNIGDLNRWTVEAWTRFDDVSNVGSSCIVSNDFDGMRWVNFSLGNNDTSAVAAGFYDTGWYNAPNTLTPDAGVWYHLAGTYDGSDIKFFINGVPGDTSSISDFPKTGGNINIAKRWDNGFGNASYLSGTIPFVKIYDRALTDSEISGSYEATKSRYAVPPALEPVQDHLELWFDSRYPSSYPGTGTDWTDLKHGVVATLGSGVSYENGGSGGLLLFDGTSNATADTPPYTSDLSTGFSIEAYAGWISFPAYDGIISYNQSPHFINLEWYGAGQTPGTRFEAAGIRNFDTGSLDLQKLYHFVCTWDGSYTRIYRDGVLVAGPTAASQPQYNNHTAVWAMGHWDGHLNGAIAMTRLYSKALSDAEVLQNYQATISPNVPA